MPQFKIKAQDVRNQPVSLMIDAPSRVDAIRQIKTQGLIPLEVVQQGIERPRKEKAVEKEKATEKEMALTPAKNASVRKQKKSISVGGAEAG